MNHSLPQLKRCKPGAQTPDEHSKRGDEISQLRNQVTHLQKQLESVQANKSFVMKIQNQQCTLCQRLKLQIEQMIKQEKLTRKQYELRIEELSKQSKPTCQNVQTQTQTSLLCTSVQTEEVQLDNISQEKEQPLNQYEQIIIDFHKEVQSKAYQIRQYKDLYDSLKTQFDQFKQQHNGCQDKIRSLIFEINVLKDNSNSYKLPDNILNLKKSIDHTLEMNTLKQVALKTQTTEPLPPKGALIIQQMETDLFVSLRCFKCKEFYNRPCTYVPCGHSVCHGCQTNDRCEKCLKPINTSFRNSHIDHLIRIHNQIREVKETCLKR